MKQAKTVGAKIQTTGTDILEDDVDALSNPLLSFVDSLLCNLRGQLYLQLFKKMLRLFWQTIIQVLLTSARSLVLIYSSEHAGFAGGSIAG